MKKSLFFILLLLIGNFVYSQRSYVYGVVQDTLKQPLTGAHITNISAGSFTVSNDQGAFKIPVKPADSIAVSYVGYQSEHFIVEEFDSLFIYLKNESIMLDEVSVTPLPTYQRFKDLVLETEGADTSFHIELPQVEIPYEPLTAQELTDQTLAPSIDVRFSLDGLTKKGKEKKKVARMLQKKQVEERAFHKFNRDWIAEQTGLKGDKLTDFIAFCDFTPEYLDKTTLFEIHERMMELLITFKEKHKGDDHHTPGA